jgi:Leucine-rich repeat (LRR) protein
MEMEYKMRKALLMAAWIVLLGLALLNRGHEIVNAEEIAAEAEYRLYLPLVQTPAYSCSEVTEIPQQECQALVAFWQATTQGSTPWANRSGWLQTSTPCSWHGISCLNGHVDSITLFSNNLVGEIPAEISNFSNLRGLYLSYNQLNRVPPEIGALSNLRWLWLSDVQLSSVPPEIGNLTNLLQLSLWENQLTSVPAEIGNLTNLEWLSLDENQLTSIPAQIGNLSNLKELHVENNPLRSIPVEIGFLTNLKVLTLNNTRLSDLPVELTNLTGLEELQLADNCLSVTDPNMIAFLDAKAPGWQAQQQSSCEEGQEE